MLDSWHPLHDSEGWKAQSQLEAHFEVSTASPDGLMAHPQTVQAIPHLAQGCLPIIEKWLSN